MLAKKQQPVIAPSEEGSISAGMAAAQAVIDRVVNQEKASHPDLPREVIRGMVTRHSDCPCRIANYLLEQERKK
jgi:hypothetical protein